MLRITMAVGPSWFRKLLICKKVFAFSYIFTHISRFYRILISFSFEVNSSGIFFASCFSASPSSSWRMSLVNTPAHPQQRFNDVWFCCFQRKMFLVLNRSSLVSSLALVALAMASSASPPWSPSTTRSSWPGHSTSCFRFVFVFVFVSLFEFVFFCICIYIH